MGTALFANIGTIMATKGSGVVKRSSGDVAAKIGLKLLEGDTIITQKKSRVQVMLLDETVVTIGANSKFSFKEYLFDGKNSKVAMSASRGFFRSVTGRIGKLAPQRFKVKTASATIGIRGTDFWGITGEETERVTCNKGAITIEYDGQVIEVEAGSYASYGPKGVHQGKINSSSKKGEDQKTQKKKQTKKKENAQGKSQTKEHEKSSGVNGGSHSDTPSTEGGANSVNASPELPNQDVSVGNIATEDISDVTQNVKAQEREEPFTMTPVAEDRPVEY